MRTILRTQADGAALTYVGVVRQRREVADGFDGVQGHPEAEPFGTAASAPGR